MRSLDVVVEDLDSWNDDPSFLGRGNGRLGIRELKLEMIDN